VITDEMLLGRWGMARTRSLLPVQVLSFLSVTLLACATDNLKRGCPSNEYRATTRNLLQLGATITYTHSITVRLDRPTTPTVTRILILLTDQLNTHPSHYPRQPPPYHLHQSPHHDQHLTVAVTLPGV
jgi:hypothetical protein